MNLLKKYMPLNIYLDETYKESFSGWGMSLYYDITELYPVLSLEQQEKYIELLFGEEGCNFNQVRYYVGLNETKKIQLDFIKKVEELTNKKLKVNIYSNNGDISYTLVDNIIEEIRFLLNEKINVVSVNPYYQESNIRVPFKTTRTSLENINIFSTLKSAFEDNEWNNIEIIKEEDSTITHWDTIEIKKRKREISNIIQVVDGGFYASPAKKSSYELKGGIGLASQICSDINYLKAISWSLWQPSGGIIVGHPDLITTFQYEVLKMFSSSIKEGYLMYQLKEEYKENILAFRSEDNSKKIIIILNDTKYKKKINIEIKNTKRFNVHLSTITSNNISSIKMNPSTEKNAISIITKKYTVSIVHVLEEPDPIIRKSINMERNNDLDFSSKRVAFKEKQKEFINMKNWELSMTYPQDIKNFNRNKDNTITFGVGRSESKQFSGLTSLQEIIPKVDTRTIIHTILSYNYINVPQITTLVKLSSNEEPVEIVLNNNTLFLYYKDKIHELVNNINNKEPIELEIIIYNDTISVITNKSIYDTFIMKHEASKYTIQIGCETVNSSDIPVLVTIGYLKKYEDIDPIPERKRLFRKSIDSIRISLNKLAQDINTASDLI